MYNYVMSTGSILTFRQALLSGLMDLASLFTKRAGNLPHYYRNTTPRVCMVIAILGFIVAVPLKILYEDIDK